MRAIFDRNLRKDPLSKLILALNAKFELQIRN